MTIYLELLWSFFQIGLFSIGGGYAAMPLIQHQVVDLHGWLNMTQFADIVTISQMTPGPIAINSATFVGTRVAGLPGAIVATVGCVLPSCIIVLFLAFLYERYRGLGVVQGILAGLRPAVVALIASAGLSLLALALCGEGSVSVENIQWLSVAIFAVGFVILRKWKLDPIFGHGGLRRGGTGALLPGVTGTGRKPIHSVKKQNSGTDFYPFRCFCSLIAGPAGSIASPRRGWR